MTRLIDANELIKRLHCTAFKDCDDREIVYSIIQTIQSETCYMTCGEKEAMLKEIGHWHDLCKSYENTIIKLSVALAERK